MANNGDGDYVAIKPFSAVQNILVTSNERFSHLVFPCSVLNQTREQDQSHVPYFFATASCSHQVRQAMCKTSFKHGNMNTVRQDMQETEKCINPVCIELEEACVLVI